MTQNLWGAAKSVLKCRTTQSYLKKQEKSQINNVTLHQKQLEKEEQRNPKVSRRKKIIKIRAEINEKELKETIAKSSEKEEGDLDTETQGRKRVKTEAEFGVMQLQAKKCLESPETERGKEGFSPRDFGGSVALTTP